MALPATKTNMCQHVLTENLYVVILESRRPKCSTTWVGTDYWLWMELKDDISIPVVAKCDPAPPGYIGVIRNIYFLTGNP